MLVLLYIQYIYRAGIMRVKSLMEALMFSRFLLWPDLFIPVSWSGSLQTHLALFEGGFFILFNMYIIYKNIISFKNIVYTFWITGRNLSPQKPYRDTPIVTVITETRQGLNNFVLLLMGFYKLCYCHFLVCFNVFS